MTATNAPNTNISAFLSSIRHNKVTLTFGSYNKTVTDETSRQVRKIGSVWSHPNFNRRTFNNDVGLVRLNNPVEFTREVRPACIPALESRECPGRKGRACKDTI